jgi:ribA/ribD-fused uncharacterized protein
MKVTNLAIALDQFAYDIDYYEYCDTVDIDDRDSNVNRIKVDILSGHIKDFIDYLWPFADDEDEVVAKRARALIEELKAFQPDAIIDSFHGEHYFLSNFYEAPVVYMGLMFKNNEAAFQAAKCFSRASEFQNLPPNAAKRLGRQVQLVHNWEEIKNTVMYTVCKDKFTRNPELASKLLATGDAKLIEGNTWNDRCWGVCNGVGENRLGKILMQIREELREEHSDEPAKDTTPLVFAIGDKVKMNIKAFDTTDLDGVAYTKSGKNYWKYMNEHPNEVYTITEIDTSMNNDCVYVLSGYMSDNTWAADELIPVTDEPCFECETRDCVFNHDGECRYALVHEKRPTITDNDGCIDGVINI